MGKHNITDKQIAKEPKCWFIAVDGVLERMMNPAEQIKYLAQVAESENACGWVDFKTLAYQFESLIRKTRGVVSKIANAIKFDEWREPSATAVSKIVSVFGVSGEVKIDDGKEVLPLLNPSDAKKQDEDRLNPDVNGRSDDHVE